MGCPARFANEKSLELKGLFKMKTLGLETLFGISHLEANRLIISYLREAQPFSRLLHWLSRDLQSPSRVLH